MPRPKVLENLPGLGWSVLVRMDRQDILAPIHAYFWKVGDHRRGGLDSSCMGLLLWATTRLRTEHRQAQQESAWAKAAEAALLQSQERNRAIVDTALDGVITIDSTGIVTDWNAQATAIFGWSREDSAGTDPCPRPSFLSGIVRRTSMASVNFFEPGPERS